MKISGWGRYPVYEANVYKPRNYLDLKKIINNCSNFIARGNGRSYGDSSINSNATISMLYFDKVISFNKKTGVLVAQSGVTLFKILNIFLSKGWFLKITPGTKYCTIGGAVSADIHGKNHHNDGSFINSVNWFELMNHKGLIMKCSRKENSDLFYNSFGAMGLTGIITKVSLKLRPVKTAWIKEKKIITKNYLETLKIFDLYAKSTYSVAWIDCLSKGSKLGRSIIMLGEHADTNEIPRNYKYRPFDIPKRRKSKVPFLFPSFILNKLTAKIFNFFYYYSAMFFKKDKLVDYDTYFYPLDKIINWNALYGKKGFIQIQFVLPLKESHQGIKLILEKISEANCGSFLTVLKKLGSQKGLVSFPMSGYTLALDFPVNNKTLSLAKIIDQIVIDFGGRYYLAKDSRMSDLTLLKSDKRFNEFISFRKSKKFNKLKSLQSERLGI